MNLKQTVEIQFEKKEVSSKFSRNINKIQNLSDILIIRNPQKKRYAFHQNQVSGFKEYKIISAFQTHFKILSRKHVFTSFSTDHSPIFFSFEKGSSSVRGIESWKFNKSLILDSKYIESIKKTHL